MADNQFKRSIAFKLKIGSISQGKPNMEADRLKSIEIDNKTVTRVNLIGNLVDKYIQEGEKKFGSLTLDDGSGQIKIKNFGDEVDKFNALNLGDTLLVIGLLRYWNNEIYLTPEIIKKKDSSFLLLRKLEVEAEMPKTLNRDQVSAMKDQILKMIKDAETQGGIEIEKIILDLKEHPDAINSEIKKLLEDGLIYEPRPGKLRYLG
ncbi:MAG: OB-fold nucleic acid binding domain-containing protein [Nanoarchaeota archaeon]